MQYDYYNQQATSCITGKYCSFPFFWKYWPFDKCQYTVSIPKARLYPFNSNGLQRHNLGRMDRSCPFCGALKWVDESCGDSSKHSPMFSTCCARRKVTLPHLQEPPALLKAYLTKNDAQSREFRQKSMSGLPPHLLYFFGISILQKVFATEHVWFVAHLRHML